MASGGIPKYMSGEDSGWIEIKGSDADPQVFSGSIFYRKVGPIVYLYAHQVKVSTALAAGANVTLTKLPSGVRPSKSFVIPAGNRGNWGAIMVGTNGNLTYYCDPNIATGTNSSIYISTVYII